MVEITNNKKNIIILFISMIIILFFIYKGFIADSDHYLKEYKNYLIKINASQYYFDKIDKNKNNNNKNRKIEKETIKGLLIKIKNNLNCSININERIINNLTITKFSNIAKLKNIFNDTITYLNEQRKRDAELINIIDELNIT